MTAPQEKPRKAARVVAILILVCALFVVFLASEGSRAPSPDAPSPGAASASAAAGTDMAPWPAPEPPHPTFTALLDGLAEKQDVAGFSVAAFYPVRDGFRWLKLTQGERWFYAGVSAKGANKFAPPVQTAGYDLVYVMVSPQPSSIVQSEIMPVLEELARRIRKNEGAVPRPLGL